MLPNLAQLELEMHKDRERDSQERTRRSEGEDGGQKYVSALDVGGVEGHSEDEDQPKYWGSVEKYDQCSAIY